MSERNDRKTLEQMVETEGICESLREENQELRSNLRRVYFERRTASGECDRRRAHRENVVLVDFIKWAFSKSTYIEDTKQENA